MLKCVYHHDHGIRLLRNNSMGPRIKEWLAWGRGGPGSRAHTERSTGEVSGDSKPWPCPPEGDGRGATRGRSAGEEGGVSAQWPRPRAVPGGGEGGARGEEVCFRCGGGGSGPSGWPRSPPALRRPSCPRPSPAAGGAAFRPETSVWRHATSSGQ